MYVPHLLCLSADEHLGCFHVLAVVNSAAVSVQMQVSFLIIYLFLFLAALGLLCCVGFSLVSESRGYSLVVPRELLIMVASLVSKHGLWVCGTQQLWLVGSTAVVHRLWCSVACGISLDQGLNLCLLHQQVDSH